MLIRKCQEELGALLSSKDFNLRITVTDNPTEGAWKETFRDAIGGGVINDKIATYKVSCKFQGKSFDFSTIGSRVIHECWNNVKDQNVVRIDLIKWPIENNKTHSWIFIKNV